MSLNVIWSDDSSHTVLGQILLGVIGSRDLRQVQYLSGLARREVAIQTRFLRVLIVGGLILRLSLYQVSHPLNPNSILTRTPTTA